MLVYPDLLVSNFVSLLIYTIFYIWSKKEEKETKLSVKKELSVNQEREAPGCSERKTRWCSACARPFPSHYSTISSLALCTLTVSSSDFFASFLHGKIKEKVLGSTICLARLWVLHVVSLVFARTTDPESEQFPWCAALLQSFSSLHSSKNNNSFCWYC